MVGLRRHNPGLVFPVPSGIERQAKAYLVVVLEGREGDRVESDPLDVGEYLGDAGALDVYVLLPGQGQQLLAARESAFWLVKSAGADDLIDMVVPRERIPEYLRRVHEVAARNDTRIYGCGHAGDGNIHFSVYQPDDRLRDEVMYAIFAMGLSLGGAISGEHGIGVGKKRYFQALEDPAKLALMRRIKAAFDPAWILNPGCLFDPS